MSRAEQPLTAETLMAHVHAVERDLQAQGLQTRSYSIPDFDGYEAVTGGRADVYCLEVRLGHSHKQQGTSAWAIAHLPDPRWRNLCFISMVEREDSTGAPVASRLPVYNRRIDRVFTEVFLPVMMSAWNGLDPLRRAQGIIVQAYTSRMTLGNLIPATWLSLGILFRFRRQGQLALIAVDFDDPWIDFIARLMRSVGSRRGVHLLARREPRSRLRVPVLDDSGGLHVLSPHSTAVDWGFEIAQGYLRGREAQGVQDLQARSG